MTRNAEQGGRYAIYFSPDRRSALGRFGRQWLGYDAVAAESVAQPLLPDVAPEDLTAVTVEPRRYGFHATLKPPFALAPGQSAAALDAALAAFAATRGPFLAPPLQLAPVDGFWALVLARPAPAVDRLAAECVTRFDHFRAPPNAAEQARRRNGGLSPAQDALLERWGYPYVLGEFRFHLTLTARLAEAEAARFGALLAPLVRPLCRRPLLIDALGLFHEPVAGAPFRLMRRYRLAARLAA